jgi:hypothetical protein
VEYNQPKGSISLDSSDIGTETALGESDTAQYETRETSDATEPFFVASTDAAGAYGAYNSPTDNIANKKKQFIEIWHVPTQLNVFFKSFITTFQDTYTTEYNKESVFGRMDPVATFKRTGRVITLGWDVPSSGLEEAKENLAKMNRLIQFLYPVYDTPTNGAGGATTMRSGPIFKIKMGNLIMKPGHDTTDGPAKDAGLPGIIEGFSYTPKLEYGVFDPGKLEGNAPVFEDFGEFKTWSSTEKTRKGVASYDGTLYPKVVSAQIRFTVLHDTPLGWEMEGANGAVLRNNRGAGTKASRFPYGGDNAPVDPSTGKRVQPYVEEADWKSFLDLQKDLAVRRIHVRAGKILQPFKDVKQFIGG